MNLDELEDALSASDPDPRGVLAQFERKRRRGRQRMLAASGGVAVAVVAVVVAGAIARGLITGLPNPGSSSSGAAAAASPPLAPAAGGAASGPSRAAAAGGPLKNTGPSPGPASQSGSSGTGGSGSCAGIPLKQTITSAVRQGASVVVATGTLTRRSVTGNPATTGAAAYYAMTLSSVQTLRGPAIAPGSTAWIPGPAPGTAASVTSALLAPGGRLFAIVWPKAATHDLVGPTLQLAPIVGGDVVFTPSGCWDVAGLQPGQYQANTPLKAVPGGAAFGGANQPAENGLYAVPLATVEKVAAQA